MVPRGAESRPSERRIEAAARAYWRELSDAESSEDAIAVSVAALERTARSPGASEGDLVRVAHMTAAESASAVASPPAAHGRLSSRHRDECTATPTRLAALFSGELLPDVRDDLLEHLEICMTCRAMEMRMRRAERAFATTVAGALTADDMSDLVGPSESTALDPTPSPAPDEAVGDPGSTPLREGDLRWITRLIEAEHASAYTNQPQSRRGPTDTACGATPSRLAARAIGRLRDDQRRELDAHLDGCLPCQATELRMLRAERAFATFVASGVAVEPPTDAVDGATSVVDEREAEDEYEQDARPEGDEVPDDAPVLAATAILDDVASAEEAPTPEEALAPEQAPTTEETATPEQAPTTEETATPEQAPTFEAGHHATGAAAAAAMAAFAATERPRENDVAEAEQLTATAGIPPEHMTQPADSLAAAAGAEAIVAFQATRSAAPRVGRAERRSATRFPGRGRRRGHGVVGRDLVLPVAVGLVAIVVAAVLLLGKSSGGNTPAPSKPRPAVSAARTAAPTPKPTTSKAGAQATKHRVGAPATHRATHRATASTPSSTSAPAASVAPPAPVSTGSAPVTPSPAPTPSKPTAGSHGSSVSVTPQGGSLPPATAPTQGISTGG
ncbi:MAG: hypothetical protein QOJ25_654 [Solirubrobacteraceae bacterium]|jgi:hypothetical protein|nr:hypothetical protein [Solirubrobacteraceae bacterium]